jgi:thioredoxin 1
VNKSVQELTQDNWEKEVLKAEGPVLVDFWAEWCGPCRALGPTIDQLATEYQGRVKIGKLNVDAQGAISQRYGVQAIPTLLVFSGGKVAEQRVGLVPKTELVRILEGQLAAVPVGR